MKLIEKDGLRILEPEKSMFIATKDKQNIYSGNIYLGKFDAPENYVEVSAEEKETIEKEKFEKGQAAHKAEEEKRMVEHEAHLYPETAVKDAEVVEKPVKPVK